MSDGVNADAVVSGYCNETVTATPPIKASRLLDGQLTVTLMVTDSFGNEGAAYTTTVEKHSNVPCGYDLEVHPSRVEITGREKRVNEIDIKMINVKESLGYAVDLVDETGKQLKFQGAVGGYPSVSLN